MQVPHRIAAVEKLAGSTTSADTTIGRINGFVVLYQISKLRCGFRPHPPGVNGGNTASRAITPCRIPSCWASTTTNVTFNSSEGWKVNPSPGILIHRDASFSEIPTT